MRIGFAINAPAPQASADMLDAFRPVMTAHISDNMSRLCGTVGLMRLNPSRKLVGFAFTVKTRPGDNLMVHKALDLARPGDVLVVDGGGDPDNALVGELMMTYAIKRQIAGFVIDGAVRDSAAFAKADFPCFARGVTHRGPYKEGPGEINVDVNIGGLVIHPGDIVVGDEEGIVAFAPAHAEKILADARRQALDEQNVLKAIDSGTWDRSWIDETLRKKGAIS